MSIVASIIRVKSRRFHNDEWSPETRYYNFRVYAQHSKLFAAIQLATLNDWSLVLVH